VKPRSLRLRLLVLSSLSLAVSLAIAASFLAVIFERHMERRVAQELEVRLADIASVLERGPDGGPVLSRGLTDPRYRTPYSGVYWQISGNGHHPLRSRSLWDDILPVSAGHAGADRQAVETDGPNGGEIYLLERDVAPSPGPPFRIAVAIDHGEIQALRADFLVDIVGGLVVLGALLALGFWLQAGLGLAPLRRLQEQLSAIHQGRATRLSGGFPSEVQPLTETLNALLERQHHLVSRARGRAGDLAHGLKTPLTILAAEAARLEEAGQDESAALVREQIGLMRGHVERELARARTHGQSAAGGLFTDVRRSAERLVDLMRRMPEGDRIVWTIDCSPALRAEMDPDDFGEVLGNLLDNARKAARSRVAFAAVETDGLVGVSVVDDGPGIAEADAPLLMQRGSRGDTASEGSGLGLSIVRDILEEYGRALTLRPEPAGGCRAAFQVPGYAAPDPAEAEPRQATTARGTPPVRPTAAGAAGRQPGTA
jgi:signal transduction histidine kinase